MSKLIKRIIVAVLIVVLLLGLATLVMNLIVIGGSKPGIKSDYRNLSIRDADCIMVLGCSVKPDGTPSDMLKDRMLKGVELYKAGVAPKLLLSGDHGTQGYDEVTCMKEFAISRGVPPEDIFLDHAGFCTYDSVVRAKKVFGVKKLIIVTQEYHLYRAVYIARSYGIECEGVYSDPTWYSGQAKRDIREIFGSCKDFLTTTFRTSPKYLGDSISLEGDGRVTHGD